jgi:hypothetical protein
MTQCARCRREAPDQLSAGFLDWEALDETGAEVVCPACLTGAERQAGHEAILLDLLDPDLEPDGQ